MHESAERVPENSPTYREFARLYELARELRPTGVDRWNHELYETSGSGGFDQATGAIGIHKPFLREGLATQSTANPRLQARALQAVLIRATEAGMELDAPGQTNAIRTTQARGLHDGVAAVRAATDLQAFSRRAGYPGLTVDDRQQSGAYAAANGLIEQVAGARVDRRELIDRLGRGPAVMQFDQLAEAVVRNRLEELAPAEGVDRQAVRHELVETMLHPQWDSLAGRSPEAGQHVADEIGRGLNAKVDEMRRRGPHPARTAESGDVQQQQVGRETPTDAGRQELGPAQVKEVAAARFLSGVAPAAGAAGRGSALGDGSRAAAARAAGVGRGTSVPRGASAPRTSGPRGAGW